MKTIKFSEGDIYTGNLILVSGDFPLRVSGEPPCMPVMDEFPAVLLHAKATACLRKLFEDIHATGRIVPVSGYRPLGEQEEIYEDSLAENGAEFTRKYVAKPGCSEHQSGLAIDLGQQSDFIDFLCPDFPDSGVCGDFRRLAARYGFIQRYTGEKEKITDIASEPWHFRYVGYPHSEIMERLNLCLEEYIEYVREFCLGRQPLLYSCGIHQIQITYVPQNVQEASVPDDAIAEVSGNNVDGHILTLWN